MGAEVFSERGLDLVSRMSVSPGMLYRPEPPITAREILLSVFILGLPVDRSVQIFAGKCNQDMVFSAANLVA